VENDHCETELREDPAFDVTQEAPSLIASMSSVVNEERRCSLTGGQRSFSSSFKAARLRLMAYKVEKRVTKMAVVRRALVPL
jgi:ribosomal protein S14